MDMPPVIPVDRNRKHPVVELVAPIEASALAPTKPSQYNRVDHVVHQLENAADHHGDGQNGPEVLLGCRGSYHPAAVVPGHIVASFLKGNRPGKGYQPHFISSIPSFDGFR